MLELDQCFRGGGQHPTAVRFDHHHVFNADAKVAWEVDTGFNGDHHACFKLLLLSCGNPGRFMDLDAHAVPGGMAEVAVQPGPSQNTASRLVYRTAANTGTHRRHGGLLRLQHRIIRELLLPARPAEVHSAVMSEQ